MPLLPRVRAAPDNGADAPETEDLPLGQRLLLRFGPLVACAIAWGLLHLLASPSIARQGLVAAGLFMVVVGPSVIFGPAVVGASGFENLSTWNLAAVAGFMSAVSAVFYTYNLDLLERLPKVGPMLRSARRRMRRTLTERPWIRRWATFGVGFFVLLPLPGSGTLGGSLMGRLVGLSRLTTVVAVTLAGVLVALVYASFGIALLRLSESIHLGLWAKVGGVLALAVGLWFLGRFLRGRARARKSQGHPASK